MKKKLFIFSYHFHHIFSILILILSISFAYGLKELAQKNTSVEKTVLASRQRLKTLDKTEPIQQGEGFDQKYGGEKPLQIVIPKLNINTSIEESPVVDGSWTVSETSANHGAGSAYPGQKGNMVVFAHAYDTLFYPLQYIETGDEIIILTKKTWYAYTVESITQVYPDQIEVIKPSADERLTLFTCSGFEDEKRLIVVGKRKEQKGGE